MTSAIQLIDRIEAVGGVLTVQGERIRCLLPEEASSLLEELRANRAEVLLILHRRRTAPAMPPGVRLIEWKLKDLPVLIESCAVVTDPRVFAVATLEQLRTAMANPKQLNRRVVIRVAREAQNAQNGQS